jgi:hypothetical protein
MFGDNKVSTLLPKSNAEGSTIGKRKIAAWKVMNKKPSRNGRMELAKSGKRLSGRMTTEV